MKEKILKEFDENLANRKFYFGEDIDTDEVKKFLSQAIDKAYKQGAIKEKNRIEAYVDKMWADEHSDEEKGELLEEILNFIKSK